MQDHENPVLTPSKRAAWNKGKLIGAKPPLRPKHVWTIRTKLQVAGRTRDLAMFNLAIDSKLRGCDVVALKVEDIAPHGYTVDRATGSPEEDGPDGSVRGDRADPTGGRRLHPRFRQEAGRIPVRQPAWAGPVHDNTAVRATRYRMGRKHRPRSHVVRHAFIAQNQGHTDLSSNRELACRPAPARPYQDREHCSLSWHRS